MAELLPHLRSPPSRGLLYHRLIAHVSVALILGFCSAPLNNFLCEYHTILITVALQYNLKWESVLPLVLFFFFNMAFAI